MAGQITTPDDVKQLGTILSVWAHPDDETFLAGGLLAAAVSNGQTVICVTATKGEAGTHEPERWPPVQLGLTREKELERALQILGVSQHYWLGCMDGCCVDANTNDIVSNLVKIAERYSPDTIITFGPDGWTGHPDHCCVSEWASQAADHFTKKPDIYHAVVEANNYKNFLSTIDKSINMYFNIKRPPLTKAADCAICLRLPNKLARQKTTALRAFTTQTENMFQQFDEDFVTDAWSVEAYVKLSN